MKVRCGQIWVLFMSTESFSVTLMVFNVTATLKLTGYCKAKGNSSMKTARNLLNI
jgi:hypothetical protein